MIATKAKIFWVPTVAVSLLLVAACATTAKSAAGNTTHGKQVYDTTCAACHGPDAKGVPGLGKDLTTSAFSKGLSDPQLVDFVKKGRPASDPANTSRIDMPPKGGNAALTDADIADVVAYVRTLER